MRYTRWWQAFSKHVYQNVLFWCLLLLFPLSASSQNNYPDFRRVCAQGLGDDIVLNWSPLGPDACGQFKNIYIYASIDGFPPYKLIDSIGNIAQTQYIHTGAKALATTWNYYIVYKFLCTGDSAYSKTLAIDFTQPGTSLIDSASVDSTGKVIIGWSPNAAPDLMAYVIWQNQGANNVPIDTITPTFFIDSFANAQNGSASYTLTALDSCNNQSVISTFHKTMFLGYTYDTCAKAITLNWTPYVGWTNLSGYEIVARINGTNFTVSGSTASSTQTFTFTAFTNGDSVDFFIRAKEGTKGFTSSSNRIRVFTRLSNHSTRNYISYATVVDSFTTEIKILTDPASDTKQYSLYRKKENDSYIKVADLSTSPTDIIHTDAGIEPYKYSYTYYFVSTDICNNFLDTSNIAKTIFLNVATGSSGNDLKWNKYKVWDAGVNQYSLYRGFDFGTGFTWNLLNTLPASDSLYSDNSLPTDLGIAGTCYYIQAQEATGNQFGEQAVSRSNTVCVVEDAVVYFPNAFAPLEVNKVFLVRGSNIDYAKTSMVIYARNGQLVKKIDDVRQGWDGTDSGGNLCVDGVYLYLCELFGLNQKKYNFSGTVHLLR